MSHVFTKNAVGLNVVTPNDLAPLGNPLGKAINDNFLAFNAAAVDPSISSDGSGELTVVGLAVTGRRPAIDGQDIFSLVFGDSAGALIVTDQQTTQSYDPLSITNNGSVVPAIETLFVAAACNGSNNLELAANARYTPAQFTLSMWVYYHGSNCFYFGNGDSGSPQGWEIFSQYGRLYFQASIGGAWARLSLSANPATGWHHIAVTFDGTTALMYVDGALAVAQTISGSVNASAQPLVAGYSAYLGPYYGSAQFANLRFCSTVRDASWINAEARSVVPTSLDAGQITTDGLGTLRLHTQASPPVPVAGGIYFDGANFNFCADGATWVGLDLP